MTGVEAPTHKDTIEASSPASSIALTHPRLPLKPTVVPTSPSEHSTPRSEHPTNSPRAQAFDNHIANTATALDEKQLTKCIRNVRDELNGTDTSVTLPSSWMIRCLVESALNSSLRIEPKASLTTQIITLLHHIQHLCSIQHNRQKNLVDTCGTPLFPNTERFEPHQAQLFCKRAIAHLGAR